MSSQSEINELVLKIAQVCSQCGHSKFILGRFECDRKKSECHSKRVRKWLAEIGRLEEKNVENGD